MDILQEVQERQPFQLCQVHVCHFMVFAQKGGTIQKGTGNIIYYEIFSI